MGTATLQRFNEDNGLAADERRYQDKLSKQDRLDRDYAAEVKRQENDLRSLVENGDLLAEVPDREPYPDVIRGEVVKWNLSDVLHQSLDYSTAPESTALPLPIDVWKVIIEAKRIGLQSAQDLLERCVKTSVFHNVDSDKYDASYFEEFDDEEY